MSEYTDKYVKERVETIVDKLKYQLIYTESTCDARNWDNERHVLMTDIANELRQLGYTVTNSINHGVTDWVVKKSPTAIIIIPTEKVKAVYDKHNTLLTNLKENQQQHEYGTDGWKEYNEQIILLAGVLSDLNKLIIGEK